MKNTCWIGRKILLYDMSMYGFAGLDLSSGIELGVASIGYTAKAGVQVDKYGTYGTASGGVYASAAGAVASFGAHYASLDGKVNTTVQLRFGGFGVSGRLDMTKMTVSDLNFDWDLDESARLYREYVGSDPDMSPGVGYAGDGTISEKDKGDPAIAGANNIGNPVGEYVKWSDFWTNPWGAIRTNVVGIEGGWQSRILNQIPGMNAFSMMHDNLYMKTGAIRSATLDVPVAMFATYGAWARGAIPW
jgi:hypothetical protein